MTGTNELRKMLNERGVEWGANDTHRLLVTSWEDAIGHSWVFMEHRDGSFSKLTAYHLTPAQAIEATLGHGTCRYEHVMNVVQNGLSLNCSGEVCSECGNVRIGMTIPRYCPNCGRKVVDE